MPNWDQQARATPHRMESDSSTVIPEALSNDDNLVTSLRVSFLWVSLDSH
jgi:hypothetical protein